MGHVAPKRVRSRSTYRPTPAETTLRHFAVTDQAFQSACEAAGVKPTARQYSKWRRGFGIARGVSRSGKRIDKDGTPR